MSQNLNKELISNKDDLKYALMLAINELVGDTGLTMREIASLTKSRVSIASLSRIRNYECELLKIDTLIETWTAIRWFVFKSSADMVLEISA